MSDSITAQLAALPKTPTPELRARWAELFGKAPPALSRSYLIRRLANRLQELAHGGLRPATRARLDMLAAGLDPKTAKRRIAERPVLGTRLVREWQGREQVVTVTRDGYEWQGRPYASLSAAARAITGTRWNGPVFFGIRGGRK